MVDEDKNDLEFKVFIQRKPSRKNCKKTINYVLAEYIKGNVTSGEPLTSLAVTVRLMESPSLILRLSTVISTELSDHKRFDTNKQIIIRITNLSPI